MIPPIFPLIALMLLTGVCFALALVYRNRNRAAIRALASSWGMSYTSGDRFNLAGELASLLPVPCAADVLVRDIIFHQSPDQHQFYFTVEYTVGVLRSKRRVVCVAAMSECHRTKNCSPLRVAPNACAIADQYRSLRDAESDANNPANEKGPAETSAGPALIS